MGWETASFTAIRIALTLFGIAIALILGIKVAVLIVEPRMAFLPQPDDIAKPSDYGLPFEPFSFTTSDGLALRGWLIPAPAAHGAARGPLTVLFFHGNAENISNCLDLAPRTRAAGVNLALVDYRGYGGNPGSPSEKGLYRDGAAALAAVRALPGVDPARIVLWGRSIGGAVAVHLAAAAARAARPQPAAGDAMPGGAAQAPPGDASPIGLILESPFASVRDLLSEGGHPILHLLSRFGNYRFDSAAKIGRITMPLLVIHGTDDEVVPFPQGRRLFDLAPGRKTFVAIPGGGHNDLMAAHARELWQAVDRFLRSLD